MNLPILDLDLTSLRFIGCGSSSLPMASQMEFMKKYLISVSNLYGLSETGPTHIDNPERENWTPGSIGEPLSVNKCKIANDGEILIKGSNVFIGYYKNSNLYNQVITDEWFHTGDLGKKIGKKYYFIERKKDLIIKGGVNIVPMEVEEELYKHCNTKECAVVAINNELYGEDVCAIVVKKSNKDNKTMTKELKMLCRENLSNNKVPMHIFYVDKMPTTHSGKIMRREVRNMAEAIINNK
jgi:long-chain acyl-CoA synthetase